jgi:hypothetical protein
MREFFKGPSLIGGQHGFLLIDIVAISIWLEEGLCLWMGLWDFIFFGLPGSINTYAMNYGWALTQ